MKFKTFKEYKEVINESTNYDLLSNLGFTVEISHVGGPPPKYGLGYPEIPSRQVEKMFHKNSPNHYIGFLTHNWRYTGFYVGVIGSNQEMQYIWKQSTKNSNVDNSMNKALVKVGKLLSKGKLPKNNQKQIDKHWNS